MKMYKMVVFTILFLQILFGFLPTLTETFTPCIEVSGVDCPDNYSYNYTDSDTKMNNIVPILVIVGLLLTPFISYKIVKKWPKLWGLSFYITLSILSLLLMFTANLNDNIVEYIQYPGLLLIGNIGPLTDLLIVVIVNIIFYCGIGWVLYKIFKKKTNNIQNGTKT